MVAHEFILAGERETFEVGKEEGDDDKVPDEDSDDWYKYVGEWDL